MDGFTGEIKYAVDGVSANERLYNERVEGLELIPLDTLFPSPGSVPVLNLAGMDIAEIYAQLQSYAFIQNCEVGVLTATVLMTCAFPVSPRRIE